MAQGNPVELAVKATYLAKIGAFVTWPAAVFAAPDSPFVLCVIGGAPLGDLVDRAVADRQFGERPISVLRLPAPTADAHCQIMYLAPGDQIGEELAAMRGMPVLTVTESLDPASKGIVNFVNRDNHVRLEIDEVSAAEDHLEISSKLLNVAVSVIRPQGQ